MKFKPAFWVAGVALFAVVSFLIWSQRPASTDAVASITVNRPAERAPERIVSPESTPRAEQPTLSDPLRPTADPPHTMPLADRLAAMSARRNGTAFDPREVADALLSGTAWKNDPSVARELELKKEEKEDGREFIRINPLTLEALMPGDEINLPMKQITSKSNLTMIVDSVGERSGLTWNGHLKEFSSENQVTLTRGKNLIVGGITTPEGHYVVQIYGNVGWIANGFTLFRASPNDATTSSAR